MKADIGCHFRNGVTSRRPQQSLQQSNLTAFNELYIAMSSWSALRFVGNRLTAVILLQACSRNPDGKKTSFYVQDRGHDQCNEEAIGKPTSSSFPLLPSFPFPFTSLSLSLSSSPCLSSPPTLSFPFHNLWFPFIFRNQVQPGSLGKVTCRARLTNVRICLAEQGRPHVRGAKNFMRSKLPISKTEGKHLGTI